MAEVTLDEAELAALQRAFASGTLRVSYDGRTVEYGSADDLLKRIRTIEREMAGDIGWLAAGREICRVLARRPLMIEATWLDRAIGAVAPRAAVRRVLARQSFDTLTRGYDGAARGRRTDGWRAPSTSADAEIAGGGALLRDRMRDLVRNNPHAAKAVSVLVNNIVGAGIIPRAATRATRGSTATPMQLWEAWSARCDADGQLDCYGLQTLAVPRDGRGRRGSASAPAAPRRSDGLVFRFRFRSSRADLLDATRNWRSRRRRAAYCRASSSTRSAAAVPIGSIAQHPGETRSSLRRRLDSAAVPAADVAASLREAARTGARRSLGHASHAGFARSRRLDAGRTRPQEDRSLRRRHRASAPTRRIRASRPPVVDADGNRVEQFEPGLIAYARGGKDISSISRRRRRRSPEWLRSTAAHIAAGFRLPYELLTGDLSQVNYSSIRAGLVEFRRMIDAVPVADCSFRCSASRCGTGSRPRPGRPAGCRKAENRGCMVAAALRGGRSAEGCHGRSSGHALRHDDAWRRPSPARATTPMRCSPRSRQ